MYRVPNRPVNYTECGVCPDNDRHVSNIMFTGVVREQSPYKIVTLLEVTFSIIMYTVFFLEIE